MSHANYGSEKFEFVVLNDILPGVPATTAYKKERNPNKGAKMLAWRH
jgi:hypothetical protein